MTPNCSATTRQPDPGDGRYTNAVLTDRGMAAVVASAPGHVTAVRSLVFDAPTPTQMEGLREAGDRILAKVDPGGRPLGR